MGKELIVNITNNTTTPLTTTLQEPYTNINAILEHKTSIKKHVVTRDTRHNETQDSAVTSVLLEA